MKNGLLWQIDHTPEEVMASYVAGTCTPAERAEVEEHCLNCEDCRAKLAVMLRVCFGEKGEEDEKHLEPLFSLGLEAAALARWQFSEADSDPAAEGEPSASKSHQSNPSWHPGTDLNQTYRSHKSYLRQAVAVAVLLTVGIGSFLLYNSGARTDDRLVAMELVHRQNRLLETRVTGGFAYQPYERQRGGEGAEVDRDQFNYVLADLTHAVASNPTTESRHALGRLYLLLGNLDRAEEQLLLAIQSAPSEPKLHVDIASLYYERSKYSDAAPLLAKAIEHYDTAIKIDSNLQEAWFNRALCYEQMSRFAEARHDWEQYLKLDSSSLWGSEARERLQKLADKTGQSK